MDKDGTVGPNQVYRDLSLQLASEGLATYRYDKRTYTYGVEIANDKKITIYDEYIDDIVSAIGLINNISEVDSDSIYV